VRGSRRILLIVPAAVAAVALFFVFRTGGDDTNEEAETTPTGTSERLTSEETVLRITVRGAGPGIMRVTVPKGRRVVVRVSSDRADEVHVHGYDIKADVTPTRTARIAFRARLAGRFEIELEERSLLIAVLTVEP
jgi:heme/copper-type cytochrome/quinol oxidase subunit 2